MAEHVIGHAAEVVGLVRAMSIDGPRTLARGDPIYEDDVITTDTGSSIKIHFLDDTLLIQGENAEIVLDEYVFDSQTGSGELLFDMIHGTFRAVSGQIAETNPEDFNLQAPLTTIGIRGTSFFVLIDENGEVVGVVEMDPGHTVEVETSEGKATIAKSGDFVAVKLDGSITSPAKITPELAAAVLAAAQGLDFGPDDPMNDIADGVGDDAEGDDGEDGGGGGLHLGETPGGDGPAADGGSADGGDADGAFGGDDDQGATSGGGDENPLVGGDVDTDGDDYNLGGDSLIGSGGDDDLGGATEPSGGGGGTGAQDDLPPPPPSYTPPVADDDYNDGGGDDSVSYELKTLPVNTSGDEWLNDPELNNGDYTIVSGDNGDDELAPGGRTQYALFGGNGADAMGSCDCADVLFGGNGADSMEGSGGNDVLYGGHGEDTLAGGAGADYLVGGSGPDVFLYRGTACCGDEIRDFTSGDDVIRLVNGAGFAFTADTFKAVVGEYDGVLGGSDDPYLVYESSTGTLYYDDDDAGMGTVVAEMEGDPSITVNDMDIVLA